MRFLKRFDRKIKLHLILCLQAMVVFFVIFSSSLSHAAVATAVGAGTAHSCAALATGGAKCWGGNSYGELGNSISGTSTTPVTVEGLEQYQIVAIDGGAFFTCALTSTGMVFCWGINDQRQLGTRAVASSRKPLQVQIPTGAAKALTVGSNHACVIDNYGNVYCWGTNLGGQLNRNTSIPKSETPLYAAGMNDVVAIKAYSSVTCYTDIAGGAKCFGNNKYGGPRKTGPAVA
ncbi:hypothetical protein GTP44_13630 [Duganella sp. FT50W]|uniref:RCC1 repeat-containing protein n=1 Tax=Duganella lactea TaxID=2692173 RepID=A0A6L8MJ89_9BURK|nr:hypothetical protein [Duganella lactea]